MNEDEKNSSLEVTEEERTFTKNFDKRGRFSILMPLPYQKANIISSTSRALGGASLDSIKAEEYEYIRMIITLNFVLNDTPKWWKGADNCADEEFLFKLWEFFLDSEKKFQDLLKKK